jgi:hypothetical protein
MVTFTIIENEISLNHCNSTSGIGTKAEEIAGYEMVM